MVQVNVTNKGYTIRGISQKQMYTINKILKTAKKSNGLVDTLDKEQVKALDTFTDRVDKECKRLISEIESDNLK